MAVSVVICRLHCESAVTYSKLDLIGRVTHREGVRPSILGLTHSPEGSQEPGAASGPPAGGGPHGRPSSPADAGAPAASSPEEARLAGGGPVRPSRTERESH